MILEAEYWTYGDNNNNKNNMCSSFAPGTATAAIIIIYNNNNITQYSKRSELILIPRQVSSHVFGCTRR